MYVDRGGDRNSALDKKQDLRYGSVDTGVPMEGHNGTPGEKEEIESRGVSVQLKIRATQADRRGVSVQDNVGATQQGKRVVSGQVHVRAKRGAREEGSVHGNVWSTQEVSNWPARAIQRNKNNKPKEEEEKLG